MNKKLFPLVALSLIIAVVAVVVFMVRFYRHPVLRVPQDYSTIKDAINAANPGNTISVASGVYKEGILIDKDNLTLIGENRNNTVIDGNKETGPVINIRANNVKLTGFTIRYSCTTCYGIYIQQSTDCSIYENNVIENNRGIYLTDCKSITLTDNIVANNSGTGIEIRNSESTILRNNTLIGNKYNFGVWGGPLSQFIHDIDTSNSVNGKPIYYWINQAKRQIPSDAGYVGVINSTQVVVKNLSISSNGQAVLFAYSTNSTAQNLNILSNKAGISLHYSTHNMISNNNISFNEEGVHLVWSSKNIVSSNNISYNIVDGIVISSGGNNNIYANKLSSNKEGMYLAFTSSNIIHANTVETSSSIGLTHYFSSNNTLYHNNFINNVKQVDIGAEEQARWDNGTEGNYWSDYTGEDLNMDGLGDTPYIIDENNRDNYPLMDLYIP